jgi:hypothetical protein
MEEGDKIFKEIGDAFAEQGSEVAAGGRLIWDGTKKLPGILMDAMGGFGENLVKAAKFDPGGLWKNMGQYIEETTTAIADIVANQEEAFMFVNALGEQVFSRLGEIANAIGALSDENLAAGKAAMTQSLGMYSDVNAQKRKEREERQNPGQSTLPAGYKPRRVKVPRLVIPAVQAGQQSKASPKVD